MYLRSTVLLVTVMSSNDSPALRQRKKSIMKVEEDMRQPLLPDEGTLKRRRFWQFIVDWWHACSRCLVKAYQRLLLWLGFRQIPQQYTLTPKQHEQLERLRTLAQTPYDGGVPDHREHLRKLWSLGLGEEPDRFPEGIRSERWKDMGWQSDDPGRDIRGAGVLSLHNLNYMVEHHPLTFKRLMNKTTGTRSEWEYPFAAASVNITYMISDLSDLYKPLEPVMQRSYEFSHVIEWLAEDAVESFGKVFVAAYNILDDLWLQREASYMEFPGVLSATRKAMAQILSSPDAADLIEELCRR